MTEQSSAAQDRDPRTWETSEAGLLPDTKEGRYEGPGTSAAYTAPDREKYDEAVRQWAFCIAADNDLQGVLMGRVFAYADLFKIGADQVVADLRTAQDELERNAHVLD